MYIQFTVKFYTCVLNRHSPKFDLDGLRWKQILNWHSQVEKKIPLLGLIFSGNFFNKKVWTVIFPKSLEIGDRPQYQLSSSTQLAYISLLCLVCLRFLSSPTTFGYAQLLWVTVKHCQIGYDILLLNAKTDSKLASFWPVLIQN